MSSNHSSGSSLIRFPLLGRQGAVDAHDLPGETHRVRRPCNGCTGLLRDPESAVHMLIDQTRRIGHHADDQGNQRERNADKYRDPDRSPGHRCALSCVFFFRHPDTPAQYVLIGSEGCTCFPMILY